MSDDGRIYTHSESDICPKCGEYLPSGDEVSGPVPEHECKDWRSWVLQQEPTAGERATTGVIDEHRRLHRLVRYWRGKNQIHKDALIKQVALLHEYEDEIAALRKALEAADVLIGLLPKTRRNDIDFARTSYDAARAAVPEKEKPLPPGCKPLYCEGCGRKMGFYNPRYWESGHVVGRCPDCAV